MRVQIFSASKPQVLTFLPFPKLRRALESQDKVNATDKQGNPTGGIDSNTIHIIVAKADTSIAFDDPNQTKKSVTDAATPWNETATASVHSGLHGACPAQCRLREPPGLY